VKKAVHHPVADLAPRVCVVVGHSAVRSFQGAWAGGLARRFVARGERPRARKVTHRCTA
jgi:hypothetical protein